MGGKGSPFLAESTQGMGGADPLRQQGPGSMSRPRAGQASVWGILTASTAWPLPPRDVSPLREHRQGLGSSCGHSQVPQALDTLLTLLLRTPLFVL